MGMPCHVIAVTATRLADVLAAGRRLCFVLALLPVLPVALSSPTAAQTTAPGGLLEEASSTTVRANVVPPLPARGPFTFPAPYNTVGVRVTNASDCNGSDCVNYVGYSYWRNTNNHVGSNTMLIMVTLNRARGGGGPTLFSYDKTTDQVQNLGPIFDAGSSLSWSTGEGWYWSPVRPTTLYIPSGRALYRYDVTTKQLETVFDVTAKFGSDKYIWQAHTSHSDNVHSATLRSSVNYAMLGCVVYSEVTGEFSYAEKVGDFDECQVDKSGRWLLIKENVDGKYGEDNLIYDLSTGANTATFLDQQGAAGHSDSGHGYMLAEDNWYSLPGAVRMWKFGQALPGAAPQGMLVYRTTDWSVDVGHVSHANARADAPPDKQYACTSHAGRESLPRANEIVCFALDGSLRVLVVAPVMTNLSATGGGSDDYSKLPKGNLDVTGRYFTWTSNANSDRLDAFVVKVPAHLLVPSSEGDGGGAVDAEAPAVSVSAPAASATLSGTVTVSASASDNVGVVGVQFKLNGVNLGAEVAAAPYALAWNTTAFANGSYAVTAVARDAAGNSTVSPPVAVSVQNSTATKSTKSVIWTNLVNVTATGNALRKTSGCEGCPDAGAVSVQKIYRRGGSVQFTASESSTLRYVGLGTGSKVTTAGQLRFAIGLRPGGIAEVRESGVYKADTRFAAGDVFALTVKGGAVFYYKNDVLFHQSALSPAFPLRMGASLLSLGATVDGAVLRQGD